MPARQARAVPFVSDLTKGFAVSVAEAWITERRKFWERRLDQLDAYLLSMKESDDVNEE